MATINITQLYQQAFKIAPRYLVPLKGGLDLVNSPNYTGIEVWQEETSDSISPLGSPILDQITLEPGSYDGFKVVDGVLKKQRFSYSGYTFPLWPMIDVSQDKVIVTTGINGKEGTIKEYIYSDDHQVTIRGVLVGDGNSYPHDQRRALNNVFKVNSNYGVVSRALNDMGIYALVLKNIQFSDLEGFNNVCTYVITALSDMDVLLTIKERLR